MISPRTHRRPKVLRRGATILAAGTLAALAGCTGAPANDASAPADTSASVTITFWHGWSLPTDLAALDANLKRFEAAHPNITVKSVPNIADDKILQGIRSPNGPDVVSSFTTDNVGAFCRGGLIDLNPLMKQDGIDPTTVFIPTRLQYTAFEGNQCTLPLLGDAFGLFYNKAMFAAAGIQSPPKTWDEFTADAVKLTKKKGDTYDPVGFMPSFQGYETQPSVWMNQWAPKYFDADGKANLSRDPAVAQFFTYQKSLMDALGGAKPVNKYRTTFGEEFSAQNAFEAGKVAMQVDGEWRIGNIRSDGVDLDYGVAPMPVPADQADAYGRGYLTGTVIGVAKASRHQQAAWELTKFLTTDTQALVSFANAIKNVPSTVDSMNSKDLEVDDRFKVFLDISADPHSSGTPASSNGGQYSTVLNEFAYDWESGKKTDLSAGLKTVDKQIDAADAQSGQ